MFVLITRGRTPLSLKCRKHQTQPICYIECGFEIPRNGKIKKIRGLVMHVCTAW